MMLKKSFFGLAKPRLSYGPSTGALPEPKMIPAPDKVHFLLKGPFDQRDSQHFKEGDAVKSGQKLLHGQNGDYVVSTVAGTITSISPFTGDYGTSYTSIGVDVAQEADDVDDAFGQKSSLPSLELAQDYLVGLPGAPPLAVFAEPEKPIHTIVIYGGDTDLLITTNQYVVQAQTEELKAGIEVLKTITGIEKVLLAVPGEMLQGYGHLGAEVKFVDNLYPSAFPQLIMQNVIGRVIPAGQSSEDLGVCFIRAEAVASLGKAFKDGRPPARKLVTVVDKALNPVVVSAVIGTPIAHIIETLGIQINDKDRLILGGPMTGSAVYSTDYPVMPDTDAIVVQDKASVALVSDYPCINCGDCVRICPAGIQVNLLVRFLEAGQYESAADLYDLYSCIDCGLCSFVCVSKIPIFQFIRLAKYELDRMKAAEAENE